MANLWYLFISKEYFNFAKFLKRIKYLVAETDTLFKVKMPFDRCHLTYYYYIYFN